MICKICEKDFVPSKRGNKSGTCSRACNARLRAKQQSESFVPKKCKQCGKDITIRQSKRVFCSETCQYAWWRGKNHYRWKGGISIHSEGYILVKRPEHPNADKRGWILQHRLIMEDHIRVADPQSPFLENGYLKTSLVVHHRNGIKSDNVVSNLQVLSGQSEHMSLENPKHKTQMI